MTVVGPLIREKRNWATPSAQPPGLSVCEASSVICSPELIWPSWSLSSTVKLTVNPLLPSDWSQLAAALAGHWVESGIVVGSTIGAEGVVTTPERLIASTHQPSSEVPISK